MQTRFTLVVKRCTSITGEMSGHNNSSGVHDGKHTMILAKETFMYNKQFCIWLSRPINSLAPEKFEWNFRYVIFKWSLVVDGWGIFCEIALILMSLDFTDDQSTLVHIMAWCLQATSHYLSQCWPRSLLPYGVIKPQWANTEFQQFPMVRNATVRE